MDTREFLRPFFSTKAAMMRFRKALLMTASEQAIEEARIKASFRPRESLVSDGDFLAYAIRYITGGTAIRRKMKRASENISHTISRSTKEKPMDKHAAYYFNRAEMAGHREDESPKRSTRQGGRLAVSEPHGEDITQDDMDTIELSKVQHDSDHHEKRRLA